MGTSFWKSGLIAIVLVVTGCGGGGGGGNPPGNNPPPGPVTEFTIVSTATGNGILIPTGTFIAYQGESINFTLYPDSGFTCNVQVNGGALVTLNSCTYTLENVQADTMVTAVFSVTPPPTTYTVEVLVEGSVMEGVVLTALPGNYTCMTLSDGTCTLSVPNGTYTITPSHPSDPIFAPVEQNVTVNGGNVSGINFVTSAAMNLAYPCNNTTASTLCFWKTMTEEVGSLGAIENPPRDFMLVTNRMNNTLAYNGLGTAYPGTSREITVPGVNLIAPAPGSSGSPVIWGGFDYGAGCSAIPQGSFGVSENGDIAAFSTTCTGVTNGNDIFLMMTDGSMLYIKVTSDSAFDWSPQIGVSGGVTSPYLTTFFASNRSGCGSGVCIWSVRTNTNRNVNDTPVLIADTGFPSDPSDPTNPFVASALHPYLQLNERVFAFNVAYTKMVYTKLVNNEKHLVLRTLSDGTEVDLGTGSDPRWSTDGSNWLLYTNSGLLWKINPDAPVKEQVTIPVNLKGGIGQVVIAPAGY